MGKEINSIVEAGFVAVTTPIGGGIQGYWCCNSRPKFRL